MRNSEIDAVIRKLEGTGKPLSEYVIRNGIATLANGVYFFKPIAEDKRYYYREFNGEKVKVEKSICWQKQPKLSGILDNFGYPSDRPTFRIGR